MFQSCIPFLQQSDIISFFLVNKQNFTVFIYHMFLLICWWAPGMVLYTHSYENYCGKGGCADIMGIISIYYLGVCWVHAQKMLWPNHIISLVLVCYCQHHLYRCHYCCWINRHIGSHSGWTHLHPY